MGTLYEIDRELLACMELDNGDVVNMETGEVLTTAALDALQMERNRKIEGIACQVKNLVAEAEAIKTEMGNLMERRKRAERRADWLREYLSQSLAGEKFKSAKCEIHFIKSTPVEIADEGTLRTWAVVNRPELLRIKEPEIDKTEIKKALKAGEEIPGAAVAERLNINIK